MTAQEKRDTIKFSVERVKHRIPVIAGTGGNNTAEVIEQSVEAQRLGADALLIVTPYYNKTTQKGLVEHYTAVAQAVDIPL
jgi:Dihydrodipicolinate synthetase family.